MPEIELETIRSTRLDIPVDENGVPILAAVASGNIVKTIRSTRLDVPVIEDENGNKIPVVSVIGGGGGGGGEGTSDYTALINKPKINGVTLIGNLTGDSLNLVTKVTGMGLSQNSYTNDEKAKLAQALTSVTAAITTYDNNLSELEATNVQSAIDELEERISNISTGNGNVFKADYFIFKTANMPVSLPTAGMTLVDGQLDKLYTWTGSAFTSQQLISLPADTCLFNYFINDNQETVTSSGTARYFTAGYWDYSLSYINVVDNQSLVSNNGVWSVKNGGVTYAMLSEDVINAINAESTSPLETGMMVTTSGGVATINLADPSPVYYVIGGVTSVVFSNIPSLGTNPYKQLTFELWLSPTGAVTFPSGIDWIGGTAPTLAVGKNNCLVFRYNNTVTGSYWVGNLAYSQAQN